MRLRARSVLTGLVAVAAMSAAPAQAATVDCNHALTASTKFSNDVGCSGSLNIGADGIVIDMNGHSVFFPGGGGGIQLNGHDRVTIKNGTVSIPDFSPAGITIDGDSTSIKHMTVVGGRGDTNERTIWGIRVTDSARGTEILSTRVTEWLYGIYVMAGSEGTTLTNDLLYRNACVGLFAEAHDPATANGDAITHSTARDNQFYGFLVGGRLSSSARDCNLGFFGAPGVWGGRLSDNTASGSGDETLFTGSDFTVANARDTAVVDHNVATGGRAGFEVFSAVPSGTTGPTVSRNRAIGTLHGFVIGGNGQVLRSNTAQRNVFDGFWLTQADGATLTGNLAGNPTPLSTTERSGNGGNGFTFVDSDGIHMSQNSANRNDLDGVLVDADSSAAQVRSTVAGRNGGNGLEIQTPSATLASNRATYNAGFGIFATPGDTDGGGNVAYGNGAGQCQNVFCTP
jgi:hypothetical protein